MSYQFYNGIDISREDWVKFVIEHPSATVFHTPFAYDVYTNSSSHEPFAYFVKESGSIVAMLAGFVQTIGKGLLAHIAKRAIIMQSPLSNNIHCLEALLQFYSLKINKNLVYTEIRNHLSAALELRVFADNNFIWEDHLDIFVNISQAPTDLLMQMDGSRRKQINRGLKRGLKVIEVDKNDFDMIRACYRIICDLYKRIALPAPEWEIFRSAFLLSNSNTGAKCFAALYGDKIVGTRVVLYAMKSVYDWYAASLEEFYSLYPNDVLPWEVFKWGHENGFSEFDFGGAGKPNVPYGVRDYKLKFGGTLVNTGRFLKIHKPLTYYLAQKIFRIVQDFKRNR